MTSLYTLFIMIPSFNFSIKKILLDEGLKSKIFFLILESHPERIGPACPHFEKCSGCAWQHWDYQGQLQQKANHVKEAIEAQEFDSNLVRNTIGMDEPWHYRNKMEFMFAPDGSMGLHEQGNFRKIISLETY